MAPLTLPTTSSPLPPLPAPPPPPALPPLPQNADLAVDIALANNPDLIAINRQVRAAGLDVNVLRADRLPTVNAVSTGRYLNSLGSADEAAGVPQPLVYVFDVLGAL